MSLNILRIAERLPPLPGGKEIHVAELTRAQLALGHRVHVRYRFGSPLVATSSQRLLSGTTPLKRVRGLCGTSLFALEAVLRARQLAEVDVVHAHGDLAEAAAVSRGPQGLLRPTVLTVHGQLNPRFRRLSKYAFQHIDAFVALGERAAGDLTACGVNPQRITVTSSGLNFDLLNSTYVGEEKGLIVAVGSLDPVKNLDTVIRAFRMLRGAVDAKLEIIGEGPLRGALELLAAGDPRISFLGHVPRERVYERVAAASVFVMASRRLESKGEGVPTALLEAMALERHCIVSAEAQPNPAVTDSASYRSFDPGRPDALATEIGRALADGTMRAALGRRAREAVSHLSWEKRALDMDIVYDSAIEKYRVRHDRAS